MINVSPVSHQPLQTGQLGSLAPPGPGPVRHTPRHCEGWSAAALLHYPLYEAGVQTVGHRVDIALSLQEVSLSLSVITLNYYYQVVVQRLKVVLCVAKFLVFEERKSGRRGLRAKY